jgi:hypothetical protein
VIQAVRKKLGCPALCDDILQLIETIPDNYKSLVAYQAAAIELVFDIGDAFQRARNQPGVQAREQIRGEQFAAFFGQHSAFVHAITVRNRQLLDTYNADLDSEIRTVLTATDWTKVRPVKSKGKGPPTDKHAQLGRLIDELRPRYPSEHSLLEALPAHQDSLRNALEGKGRANILDDLLRKAQKLARLTPVPESVEVKDPHSFAGSFISSLNSFVRMGEAAGIDPQTFTDGDRDRLIRIMTKLAALARIDEDAIKRLQTVVGLAADDPVLRPVLSVLRGVKKP